MPERAMPRYPIYVPSKGRAHLPPSHSTAYRLQRDGVPFRFVIEEADEPSYRSRYPTAELLVLPFSDAGSVIPARNWIKDHAIAEGHARHWQLDDNIKQFRRFYRTRRINCHAGLALRVCEDFTDRYTNIAISGLNYEMFVPDGVPVPPFWLNCHVYSCCLFDNRLPFRWRGRYNEDTDLCLQALAAGYCTVALNAFLAHKDRTMNERGGNTDALDYHNDGRLRMARALERQWPHVVSVERRYGRPQHVIRGTWRGFDQPLIRRDDLDWEAFPAADEYGSTLAVLEPIQSARIQALADSWEANG